MKKLLILPRNKLHAFGFKFTDTVFSDLTFFLLLEMGRHTYIITKNTNRKHIVHTLKGTVSFF